MRSTRGAWPWILLILLTAIVIAFGATYYYQKGGVNAYLAFAALLIAMATLLTMIFSLFLTRRSLELTDQSLNLTRLLIRPLVSVLQLQCEYGTSTAPQNSISSSSIISPPISITIPIKLHSFSILLQNTGPVPATKLNIRISFIASDSTIIGQPFFKSLPLLAPNTHDDVEFPEIQEHIQRIVEDSTKKIEVIVKYEGISISYDTRQTFEMERTPLFSDQGPPFQLLFKSIYPSDFS